MDSESNKRKSGMSTAETEELIQLVHNRPCLWDRSMNAPTDKVQKEKAWLEIYRQLEPSYDDYTQEIKNLIGYQITRKWYNIRDSYVKSKKTQTQRIKPYKYSKLLGFLDAVHFKKNFKDSVDERSDNDVEEHWLNEVLVVDHDRNDEPEAKKPRTDSLADKESGHVELESNVLNVLADMIHREDDEDRAFFRSILPAVKKLSEEAKFEFRIELMNILKNLLRRSTVKIKCEIVERTPENSD